MYGYRNETGATYKIFEDYLEVLQSAGTTLSDCGEDESIDFFSVKGQINHSTTTDKVFYECTEDKKRCSLWIDENHKLYFAQKVLSVAENIPEKAISRYPNPSEEIINIDEKLTSIKLSEISITDSKGKGTLKKIKYF
ncbi:MAG: hypothetical protein ACJA2L_001615 [Polaribacter sp.]|jgi:hypothetical protein